jgi:hypothetical protein
MPNRERIFPAWDFWDQVFAELVALSRILKELLRFPEGNGKLNTTIREGTRSMRYHMTFGRGIA